MANEGKWIVRIVSVRLEERLERGNGRVVV
jgi:hypothetical protein